MTVSTALATPQRFPALDLTPHQELALLARALHAEGYDDHLAGHITYKQSDGSFLVTPWGLTWDELHAHDVALIDAKGNRLEGTWEISPAVELHILLHQRRRDARVVVHNHPRWGTIWASCHRIPPIYDQTSAGYSGEIAIDASFEGPVNEKDNAAAVVTALGRADVAFLVNHGVLIIGDSVEEAYVRAAVMEWRCRTAWHVESLGGGVPIRTDVLRKLELAMDSRRDLFDGWFEASVRRIIRQDPSVLE